MSRNFGMPPKDRKPFDFPELDDNAFAAWAIMGTVALIIFLGLVLN